MPASTCDPVNEALRHALSGNTERTSSELDSRLVVSAKSVLNSHIEFEQAETYKSTVLDKLKTKYIVLGTSKVQTQMTPEANKADDEISEPKHILFPLEAVQLGWRESGWHTGVGMVNTGNTCYLNSTLQALFHVPALTNWLISDREHRNKCDNCMVCAVAKTLISSQSQTQQPIRPWMVSSKLRVVCRHLVPGRQEDAHEFLRYLVEAMERAYIQRFRIENLDARSKETTPLNQILGGYLRSAVRCLQCGHVSTTVQHFQDLLLDIRKASTLDDALASYFACERLDDLAYRCESCRRKVSAVKQFSLERAPYVLCIQLKRFAGAGGKITKHIAFRQRLELTRFSHRKPATPLVYKLVALVTHMGMSANCGHYTAIGLTPSGNYYEFDDCSVRSVSQQIVLNTNAYIMFYELEKDSQQLVSSSNDKINGKMTIKTKSTVVSTSSNGKITNSPTIISTTANNNNNSCCSNSSSSATTSILNNNNNTVSPTSKTIIPLPFKNMIPTPVRNKLNANNSNDENCENQSVKSPNKIQNTENGIKHSLKVNGIKNEIQSPKLNGLNTNLNRNNNNNLSPDLKCNDSDYDMSRLLDTPPSSKSSVNESASKSNDNSINNNNSNSMNCKESSRLTDFNKVKNNCSNSTSNFMKNGIKYDTPVMNGTSNNRRLVPYDSDGGSSTSESEEAPSGKWLITVRSDSRTPSQNGETGWRCQTKAASILNTTENNNNNESSCQKTNGNNNNVNNFTPTNINSNNNSNTVSQLLRTSHSGYGTSIVSWSGGRSALEKDVSNERREQFKRNRMDVDDMDRGRIKKIKRHNNIPRSNPGYNPFQEYQQQNHRWSSSISAGSNSGGGGSSNNNSNSAPSFRTGAVEIYNSGCEY